MKIKLFFLSLNTFLFSQNIDVNNEFNSSLIRNSILNGDLDTEHSLNIRPLNSNKFKSIIENQYVTILDNPKKTFEIKFLGLDYFLEYN